MYKDEMKSCSSVRGRFQQFYVHGKVSAQNRVGYHFKRKVDEILRDFILSGMSGSLSFALKLCPIKNVRCPQVSVKKIDNFLLFSI